MGVCGSKTCVCSDNEDSKALDIEVAKAEPSPFADVLCEDAFKESPCVDSVSEDCKRSDDHAGKANGVTFCEETPTSVGEESPSPIVEPSPVVPPECKQDSSHTTPRLPTAGRKDSDATPEFNVMITKRDGMKLGIKSNNAAVVHLLITEIEGVGLVAEWNKANPNKQVEVNDCIIEVNGARGNAEQLVQRVKEDEHLNIIIRRPKQVDTCETALDLCKRLRVCEAAAMLQRIDAVGSQNDELNPDLREAFDYQLKVLAESLNSLGNHPHLAAVCPEKRNAKLDDLPDELLGVKVPKTPASARSDFSFAAPDSGTKGTKRDVLDISFDLDEHGRRVEASLEFHANGSVSIQWSAAELPIPLPYVLCLIQEIDLLPELAPFMQSAEVLHQFQLNEADRLLRIVSKPPIPFVAGLEAVAQRFGFDLLDTRWEAFCLAECGPQWAPETGEQFFRGVPRPPPVNSRFKQVEVKNVTALGRPVGAKGELTTVLVSASGDLQVPRSVLPNWLITWLVKQIGHFIYKRALDRVAKFDDSEHGKRLRGSAFYAELHRRIEQYIKERDTAAQV